MRSYDKMSGLHGTDPTAIPEDQCGLIVSDAIQCIEYYSNQTIPARGYCNTGIDTWQQLWCYSSVSMSGFALIFIAMLSINRFVAASANFSVAVPGRSKWLPVAQS